VIAPLGSSTRARGKLTVVVPNVPASRRSRRPWR